MRIVLLHNPGAGIGEHDRLNLIGTLTAAGHEVVYCDTKRHRLADFLDRGCDVAMSGGGDGTVAGVALSLVGTGLPLAVLPLGTSNNIAHSMGTAFDVEAFARGLADAQRCRMEIGTIEGLEADTRRFVEAVGLGVIASLTLDTTAADLIGEARVAEARRQLKKAVEKFKAFDMSFEADGRPIEGSFLAVEALLHGYAGPRLPLVPEADITDGRFELVLVREEARQDFAAWLHEPEKGLPPVERVACECLRFDWSGTPPLRVDDEFQEKPSKPRSLSLSAGEAAIDVLIPAGGGDPHATRAETRAKVEA
jgi:diacylglycerol kinase family enzyme